MKFLQLLQELAPKEPQRNYGIVTLFNYRWILQQPKLKGPILPQNCLPEPEPQKARLLQQLLQQSNCINRSQLWRHNPETLISSQGNFRDRWTRTKTRNHHTQNHQTFCTNYVLSMQRDHENDAREELNSWPSNYYLFEKKFRWNPIQSQVNFADTEIDGDILNPNFAFQPELESQNST